MLSAPFAESYLFEFITSGIYLASSRFLARCLEPHPVRVAKTPLHQLLRKGSLELLSKNTVFITVRQVIWKCFFVLLCAFGNLVCLIRVVE